MHFEIQQIHSLPLLLDIFWILSVLPPAAAKVLCKTQLCRAFRATSRKYSLLQSGAKLNWRVNFELQKTAWTNLIFLPLIWFPQRTGIFHPAHANFIIALQHVRKKVDISSKTSTQDVKMNHNVSWYIYTRFVDISRNIRHHGDRMR